MSNFAADHAPRVIFSASAVAYTMANIGAGPLTYVYITAHFAPIISSIVAHRMSFYFRPDHRLKRRQCWAPWRARVREVWAV
jgi:hypothetical protein